MNRSRLVAALGVGALLTGCGAASTSPGAPAPLEAASPGNVPNDPAIVVRRGDITAQLQLGGAVERSTVVRLLPSEMFTLTNGLARGQVTQGDQVGVLSVDPATAEALATSRSGIDSARLSQLKTAEGKLFAPVTGLMEITPSPQITAAGNDVVVPLTPLQRLRLESDIFTAVAFVETVTGVREVECLATWIDPESETDSNGEPTTGTARCRLPHYVESAPGLRASLSLTGTTVSDTLLVPNLYVGYDRSADSYTVTIREDGTPRTIPVTVGLTDGVMRAVLTDIPVGAELIVPGDAGHD